MHQSLSQTLNSEIPSRKENLPETGEIIQRSESPTPLLSLNRLTQEQDTLLNKPSHTITLGNSILSLACSNEYLFSGSQEPSIQVWDLITFQPKAVLKGHNGGVLCLTLSTDQTMLFSSSGDSTVRVWRVDTLDALYVIQPCCDVGDLFSVVYSDELDTIYIGCQNTSILRFDLSTKEKYRTEYPSRSCNFSKFFDALSSKTCGVVTPIEEKEIDAKISAVQENVQRFEVDDSMVHMNSHNGYVYSLILGKNKDGRILISGSGDGDVKVWSITKDSMELLRVLKGTDAGILTFAMHDELLFCGAQGGDIKIYDLETYQHIRSLMAHDDDILALTIGDNNLFSGSADGIIKRWNKTFEISNTYKDHTGIVLSLTVSPPNHKLGINRSWLISANDQLIKFWDLETTNTDLLEAAVSETTDVMRYALSKWISLQTVSGNSKFLEECFRGAKFLKSIFEQLGADSSLIPVATGQNPLVFGKFNGINDKQQHRRLNVLVYGHYDVIDADETKWLTNPFEMIGKDGYLYGRGTTDNKGPMLAAIFAVSELQQEKKLRANVSFLVEGEEENGSIGFHDVVEKSKTPCLTYGLRGVIGATIEIFSEQTDLHSGMQGGAVSEPLNDMIRILAKLISDDNHILIPGFYDNVRPVTPYEERLYEYIVKSESRSKINNANEERNCNSKPGETKESLMSKWRYPSLTIHKIDVSGPDNVTVIPCKAKANVSMRIVPDQDINEIVKSFEDFIKKVFDELKTENKINVSINNLADWWLGDPENQYFKAAEQAIEQEYGIKPLYIREGGSIPAVRCLEKKFNAKAIHLPIGQSTDQAHLNNERISLQNLYAGKRIFKNLFNKLSEN
ncbi:4994_t:CDS:10 [Funneliformis caledonium]|uniref:4994_t:CDS:1 n=1 Tax=Funneliformis caledonium TaxID=1117310 RepID=A0A9N8Z616_9GLOM|nr:4994_t:CDS:10 [Funneliformis caledonium]